MPKTVKEVEFKFYLCYLDALLDQNAFIEKVEIEDNHIPEQLQSKQLSGNFRIKSFHRNANFIEKIYLKIS